MAAPHAPRGSFRNLLAVVVTALLFAAVSGMQASAATTTLKTISVKTDSIAQAPFENRLGQAMDTCPTVIGAHFVITAVDTSDAPQSITVQWSGGPETVAIKDAGFNGSVAQYTTALNHNGQTILDATAQIFSAWAGQFNVSHYICADTAKISIGPSAINDIGAGQTSHTFTVTVTGTNTLANPVTIGVTVPGATIGTNTCGSVAPSTNTATCSVTITSSAPAGTFTAHATASGTVGADAFSVATDGTNGSSVDATKLFACVTHNLTLTVTGAGKSQPSYDNFTGGNWVVSFDYTLNGGTTWVSMTPVVMSGSGLGNLSFTANASVPTPDPYTATANWRWAVTQTTPSATIFASGLIGNIGLTNSGDCSASDNAVSPVSDAQVKKAQAGNDGSVNVFSPGLSGWTITATSGNTTLSATTGTGGTAQITGLDDLVAWQICETPQNGWVQTVPSYGGCYTRPALPGVAGTYLFGNAPGRSTTHTALQKANGDAVANGSALDLGTSMKDTATVTTTPTTNDAPAPTGTVTFTFSTGQCGSGTPVFSTQVGLNALISDITGALGAGDYFFQAVYSGDDHYAGSTSECEPFHINKANLSLVTTMYSGQLVLASGGQLPAGTLPRSVRDTATVSGLVDGFAPANNVTFQYFTNGTCATTGAAAGNAPIGQGGLADGSATESITGAGSYSFLASVLGDNNYNGGSAACESFTVTTVTVNKLANGGNATFNFTLGDQTPSVTTTGTPGTGSSTVVVLAGSFILGEGTQDGWQLVGIVCAGGNASFTAAAGTNTACNVENTHNGATRTQGFWATHTDYANAKWANVPTAGAYSPCLSQTITATASNGQNILMGSFWSNIANTTTGAKRTAIGKARMQLLQQLTAALLNKYGLGADDQGKIAAAVTAYCGTNTTAITNATGVLSTWNQSGDTVPLTGPWQGSATTSKSKAQAMLTYWDTHNQ